jgi:hypothetical protein
MAAALQDGDVMKSLLVKIAIHKAVGVYLGEHEVFVSKVAGTPLGAVEIASSSAPYTPDDLPGVLERLVAPLLGRKRRVPVAVGLPSSRLFFGTRLASSGGTETSRSMLEKVLCSSNIAVDDLAVDLLKGQVGSAPAASVAACRKKYMTELLATLGALRVRPFRAEPSPYALIRLAAKQHPAPRRAKTVLRVFLGPGQGLAALVAGQLPLCWRTFALPAGAEGPAILSVARTLRTQERHYGIESSLDYAIVHGRADLHEGLREEHFATDMETRVLWHDGPALDGASMALGSALGCLEQSRKAFDLARSLKSRASIREIFPWADLAFTSALVVGMALVLGAHAMKLDESYTSVRVKSGQHTCLSSTKPDGLERDTEDLKKKVEAVRTFLDGRVAWSAYLHDVSGRLPGSIVLTALDGQSILDTKGGGLKKSLTFQAAAAVLEDGVIPREIDAFLSTLRDDPLLKREFSSVECPGISPSQSRGKNQAPQASFSIVCVPGKGGKK